MLNSKQRAALRALANRQEPILHVGKGGINDNLIKQAEEAIVARELIKGTVLETAPIDAKEALEILCQALRAEPVQAIGRKFVLYRKNHENPVIQV
ncbi:MAG: YhbY family RNA-binding protein [Clostridia bacterium]|nr:YhbY family RNA-binding protein [Clostridia bacterium]MBQ9989136.1 YhbY family RNA-binding protein [Clostridia bacterium]